MDREQMCAAVDAYVAQVAAKDPDALAALFTEDATLHEPWGVAEHHGREQIREFFRSSAQADFTVSRHTPITVLGHRAVMMLKVEVPGKPAFASTDIFEFSDDGLFTSMRAIPDPAAVV